MTLNISLDFREWFMQYEIKPVKIKTQFANFFTIKELGTMNNFKGWKRIDTWIIPCDIRLLRLDFAEHDWQFDFDGRYITVWKR